MSGQPPRPRTALVLYGSETGNAADVAQEVGQLAERLRFDTTVLEMDGVQLRDLLKPTVVIFVLSTTGQGEMPQNARAFWKTLLSGALKPGVLRRVTFSSFGLGDSSYARFNVAHRMLCGRMAQLGAQAFCERGEGNEQHPEGHSAGSRVWLGALKHKLLEVFPLPNGVGPIADDVFLEPSWKLELSPNERILDNVLSPEADEASDDHQRAPSRDLLPIKKSCTSEIISNDRVTSSTHFQDVRLMELRVPRKWDYGPGAIATVYPKNFPQDVQDFIELMGWQHVAARPLELKETSSNLSRRSLAVSPLDHVDLSGVTLTLTWLLENVLDFMSIPRRSFFAWLGYFASENTEEEKYQKNRLLELANPELIDELWDYTTRPKRTILEVMMDFTTVRIPWRYATSVLPLMKGRQFSIASGGDLRHPVDGETRLQLLVAIADPPSPIIKWRRRYGICTRYIASLQPGQKINIGLHEGYLDVQPSEVDFPVVMIGPGTGLAPMRSMIYQRLLWAIERGVQPGKRLEGDTLVFGCRSERGDYFFSAEWDHLARNEGLIVLTAFSRDKDKPKQYVQDQIRKHGAMIHSAIVDRVGKAYVCGSSGNMPNGVRQALLDVFVAHGPDMTESRSEEYFDQMEKDGRYKQETW